MTKLLTEIGLIAMLQPILAFAGEAVLPPGFDMTGLTNLGATAVVSMLLVWVVTKDRPAERDAFLVQLAANQKLAFESIAASRTEFLAHLSAARAEAIQERSEDRDMRHEIAEKMQQALSGISITRQEPRK